MRIEELMDEHPTATWEKYQNYRMSLEQDKKAADAEVSADGTQESSDTKRVSGTEECQTCKNRRYQDGSDDPGVSFKTPTNIAPERAASAVRGHEMEHVSRERSAAMQENREVVSQSVAYHTAICPECGDVYVSGGTTRTTTKAKKESEQMQNLQKDSAQPQKGIVDAYA